MAVPLPVILGACAFIAAVECIIVVVRRRRRRARAHEAEAVEAVFVHDIPTELEPYVAAGEPHSEPARTAHAHVYPVHKLQQAIADGPITFGPTHREPPEPEIELLVEPIPVVEPLVSEPVAPRLEVVPDPDPEPEPAPEPEPTMQPEPAPEPAVSLPPVVPVMAREPVIELSVEQEPEVETAPVTAPVPTAEVATLAAQIEVLTETIARLTERIEAVAAVAPPEPAETEAEFAPEPESEPRAPEPFGLRSVVYEPEAEFALETELQPDVEPMQQPEPVPQSEIVLPKRSPRPSAAAAVEPPPYGRKRVDDDLLAWPSDEDLERFSGRQGRRDG